MNVKSIIGKSNAAPGKCKIRLNMNGARHTMKQRVDNKASGLLWHWYGISFRCQEILIEGFRDLGIKELK